MVHASLTCSHNRHIKNRHLIHFFSPDSSFSSQMEELAPSLPGSLPLLIHSLSPHSLPLFSRSLLTHSPPPTHSPYSLTPPPPCPSGICGQRTSHHDQRRRQFRRASPHLRHSASGHSARQDRCQALGHRPRYLQTVRTSGGGPGKL